MDTCSGVLPVPLCSHTRGMYKASEACAMPTLILAIVPACSPSCPLVLSACQPASLLHWLQLRCDVLFHCGAETGQRMGPEGRGELTRDAGSPRHATGDTARLEAGALGGGGGWWWQVGHGKRGQGGSGGCSSKVCYSLRMKCIHPWHPQSARERHDLHNRSCSLPH